ncbi:MAG: ANTAR domain-containing protein [Treponema sp.]|nr:ANTAR domain-containing protein [Treponema sp.]
MDSVLIVSNTSATFEVLSLMLGSEKFSRISTMQSGNQARQELINGEYDLIVIDAPLPDELGDDFALHAAEQTSAGIILIVENEILADVNANVEEMGIFVMPKPASPEFFYQAVKLLTAARNRISVLEDENKKLQDKISEIRLVDRAKLVLIQRLEMTEQQAHRYIEKQSMDMRQSRAITAQNILKTYDL